MKKQIYIPKSKHFPQYKNNNKKHNNSRKPKTKTSNNHSGNIIGNDAIDSDRLAMLINLNHLIANINWLYVIEISEIIGKANPALKKLLEHPVSRIREHASAMVSIVDEKLGEEFSEGFEDLTEELKNLIYEYVRGNRNKE